MLAEKKWLLEEIEDKLVNSHGFIVTRYQNMPANLTAEFRNELAKAGSHFFALKKRMFIKAVEKVKASYEINELQGHVGLVLVQGDFIDSAKAVLGFQKNTGEMLTVLGGIFEGKKCSSEEIKEISSLPPLDVIRSQLLGTLVAPMTQTLGVIQALLTSVIYCVDNKVKKESNV